MINKILGIGIDEYSDNRITQLNNCQSDLNQTINLLQSKYNFDDVDLLLKKEQTTKSYIYNKIYNQLINGLNTENLLIIFMGHGEYNPYIKTSFWLPSDANKDDQSSWISIYEILNFLKHSNIFHFCLVADNCYSGAIFQEKFRGGGFPALESKKSRFALTSGSIEKVKDGIPGESSPFNKVFREVLEENKEKEISFDIIANQVITKFPKHISQTPQSGELQDSGHEGGAFILRLKEKNSNSILFKEINLPLNIYNNIKINYECFIPFFEETKKFDTNQINVSIQNIAYTILENLRSELIDSNDFFSSIPQISDYYYNINYSINLISEKFISINILIDRYLGGSYPSIEIKSLNYSLRPERRIKITEIIDIDNKNKFLEGIIQKYSDDPEQKEVLMNHLEYVSLEDLNFYLTEENIAISFLDYLPNVVKCYSLLFIPLTDFNLNLGEVYPSKKME